MASQQPQQSVTNYSLQFRINAQYMSDQFKDSVRCCLNGSHEDSLPFPHFAFAEFLADSAVLSGIRRELQSAAWMPKNNDLYSLSQTVDLADFHAEHYPILSAFRDFMLEDVRKWLMRVTGVSLDDRLALTGSRYSSGDCLLPHDDKLEGRAFAFVLYLTPGWEESDGGQLCLFDSDPAKNYPGKIVKRIQPRENTFSLFPVQHNSWHSVSEVLSEQKQRLSLNGWFHYAPGTATVAQTGPNCSVEEPICRVEPSMNITLAEVNEWLSPNYIRPGQHRQIKRIFAYKSELSLQQFLNNERYNKALDELEKAQFESVGPPHKSLLRLFRSEAITLLLTQWTGLHLYDLKTKRGTAHSPNGAKMAAEPPKKRKRADEEEEGTTSGGQKQRGEADGGGENVRIASFIHRFEKGCYLMADDQLAADTKSNGFCLDVMLFFGRKPEWSAQNGGFVSYFAVGETNEILRVVPTMNTAAIVFREPEVLNFTKYLNHRTGDGHFFVLSCSFFGISTGESESESSLESDDEEEGEFGEEEEEAEGEQEEEEEQREGI
ncbi:hypothetical protein niasHS_002593 [Heterodera schachtii]|uniref:Prolyl 4-hydroxylase alpha subunit domain-containing protein n=1 Tax=Heterodera schachtii TaxID=97005 RepID=A0ABD2KKV5_HETSC